jgi:hypothetical protein
MDMHLIVRMRTEKENVYWALITLELVLFLLYHLVSILHLGFDTATHGSVLPHDWGWHP